MMLKIFCTLVAAQDAMGQDGLAWGLYLTVAPNHSKQTQINKEVKVITLKNQREEHSKAAVRLKNRICKKMFSKEGQDQNLKVAT